MKISKSYKFRIYPNKTQQILINKTFGCVRFAWNKWVENFNKSKDEERIFKTPKELRQEFEWMKEVSFCSIQQKERDFIEFKKQFFNKKRKKIVGRPKFKSRRNKQSFKLSNIYFDIRNNKIQLSKLGLVKISLDQQIPSLAKFMNVTISKDRCNSYYASILTEQEIQELPKTGNSVGLDVGLKSFATLSDGTEIENPKYLNENQVKIKKIQRHLSRKKSGSGRWNNNRLKLAREHRKVARRRSFFLHNLSSWLVHHYDLIAVEDLNVSGMLKNHCLAKSISDVSWSEFFRQLVYKCSWYGKKLQKIDRFFPSSKTCSSCGYYYKDLTLDIREYKCPDCGSVHDRDHNASINILNEAVRIIAVDSSTKEESIRTQRECQTSLLLNNIEANLVETSTVA